MKLLADDNCGVMIIMKEFNPVTQFGRAFYVLWVVKQARGFVAYVNNTENSDFHLSSSSFNQIRGMHEQLSTENIA